MKLFPHRFLGSIVKKKVKCKKNMQPYFFGVAMGTLGLRCVVVRHQVINVKSKPSPSQPLWESCPTGPSSSCTSRWRWAAWRRRAPWGGTPRKRAQRSAAWPGARETSPTASSMTSTRWTPGRTGARPETGGGVRPGGRRQHHGDRWVLNPRHDNEQHRPTDDALPLEPLHQPDLVGVFFFF